MIGAFIGKFGDRLSAHLSVSEATVGGPGEATAGGAGASVDVGKAAWTNYENVQGVEPGLVYAKDQEGDKECDLDTIIEFQTWKWRFWSLGHQKYCKNSDLRNDELLTYAARMFHVHLEKFVQADKYLFLQDMRIEKPQCDEPGIEGGVWPACGPSKEQWRTHMLRSPVGLNQRCAGKSNHACNKATDTKYDEYWFGGGGEPSNTFDDFWTKLNKSVTQLQGQFKKCNTLGKWCRSVGWTCNKENNEVTRKIYPGFKKSKDKQEPEDEAAKQKKEAEQKEKDTVLWCGDTNIDYENYKGPDRNKLLDPEDPKARSEPAK